MTVSNVTIIDADGQRSANVTIENKTITNIEILPETTQSSLLLIPSLIDLNVKVKDNLLNGKTMDDLAHEACMGGVHEIVLNPESNPPIDNEIVLEFIQNHNGYLNGAQCHSIINSTNSNKELTNIAILLKRGAVAPFMSTKTDNILTTKIAQYAKMYDVTLFCRAEDKSLSNDGVMNEGEINHRLGLSGISAIGELLHVSRMIEIARYYGIKILFQSIASPKSIELISKAKKEGVHVSCEVSIHHILHSDTLCEDFNTTAKIYPPLSSESDKKAMQKALHNGEIDILTTLHQPSSPVNKEVAFADASYGCEAVQYALPLYFTKLVQSKMITMSDLITMCVTNPAKAMGKNAGTIQVGSKNFILFDTAASFVINNSQSLYDQEKLNGAIRDCS